MPHSDNNTTMSMNFSISTKDQTKITREYKKVKCLETLANKYKCSISQIESIVNKPKRNTKAKTKSPIKANSHLVSLVDKVVYEWFQRAQRLVETGTVTDEMFLQKAQESKQIFGIQNFEPSYEWVQKFRKKYNITALDMTLLRIENDSRALLSVDINEIILYVLEHNPITEELISYSNDNPQINYNVEMITDTHEQTYMETNSNYEVQNDRIPDLANHSDNNHQYETQIMMISDNIDIPSEVKVEVLPPAPAITNDEEARRHLKPLEEYVLLKENFRAIGLISQLEEIFAAETN